MPDADDCPFCAIVDGDAPASVVYEDDHIVAFLDLFPINEGHTLVVPKTHLAGLAPLDESTGGDLFRVGMRVAAALRGSAIPTDGIDLFLADGEAAGQTVFHLHLHVIPRTTDDDVEIFAPKPRADRADLDEVADDIADSL